MHFLTSNNKNCQFWEVILMQIMVTYNPLSASGRDTALLTQNSAIRRPSDSRAGNLSEGCRDPAAAL